MRKNAVIFAGFIWGATAPAILWADNDLNWSGPYIGITAGGAEVSVDGNWDPGDLTGPFDLDTLSGTGSSFQAVVGYQFQTRSDWVFGVEADFGGLHFQDDIGSGNARLDTDSLGSVRVRAGFNRNAFLYYATAGWSWMDYDLSSRNTSAAGSQSYSTSGPVVGIGAEAQISPHARLRGELTYFGLDDTVSLGNFPDTPASDSFSINDVTAFRISLTLHR